MRDKDKFMDVDKSLYQFQKENTIGLEKRYAYRYYGKNITYDASIKQIEAIAKVIANNHVQKGDPVAVISPALPEVVDCFYAINKNGAIFFPIDPRVNATRMKDFLNFTGTKCAIMFDQVFGKLDAVIDQTKLENVIVISAVDSMFPFLRLSYQFDQKMKTNKYYRTISKLGYDDPVKVIETLEKYKDSSLEEDKKILKNLKIYQKTREVALKNLYYTNPPQSGYMRLEDAISEASNVAEVAPIYDKDIPATLTFTSGTTGKPKLVPTMNRSYNVKVRDYSKTSMPIREGDRMLGMPPFIMYGEVFMHMAYAMGVQNVLIPDLVNSYYPDLIRKNKVSHAVGVPAHALALARDKKFNRESADYLKTVSVGGGKLLLSHEQEINASLSRLNIKVTQGYSMSELTPSSMTNTPTDIKEGSLGKPLGDTEVIIADPKTMEPLGPNQSGTILVHSETQFNGYYNNEVASDHVFVDVNGKVYVNTEDRGYYDEDGYYYMIDRYKDMITGPDLPHNIFPRDLEEVLATSPLVEDCAVVGMPYPDYENPKGEYPKAHIQLKEIYQEENEAVIEERLRGFCLEHLPENEVPYYYAFHKEIPKTPQLKTDVLALKEWDKQQFEAGYQKVKQK